MANTQMERCPTCGNIDKTVRWPQPKLPHLSFPCGHPWHSTPAAPETAPQFTVPELQEHAIKLGAIGMCGINRELWETRREIILYIEEHFLPKRSGTPRKEEA